MLLNLKAFQYATLLDLNMVYYHIRLSKEESNLRTIILPWGKYKYKHLPMGVCNSSDIFQDKMNEMFRVIEFIRAYIDELLTITKVDWSDHFNKLELLLKNLRANGHKFNMKRLFFGHTKMEYLGFWVTGTGIQPVN